MRHPEDDSAAVPFHQRGDTASDVRLPRWLVGVVLGVIVLGVAVGLVTGGVGARGLVRAVFFSSAFGYLVVALVDFGEHFRLEKIATGRYLSFSVVPVGESLNHAATVLVLAGFLTLARRPAMPLAGRDWFCLLAPALFLALGWRDEIVYHRRRSVHREDILHTVAHLAVGVMLGSFILMRMVTW